MPEKTKVVSVYKLNGRHRVIDMVFVCIFFLVFVWFVAGMLFSTHISGSQDRNHLALGELVQGMIVQQTVPVQQCFLADTICYHVLFATYRRTNHSVLQVSLMQGDYRHVLRLDTSALMDNQFYPLCFPTKGLANGTAVLEIAGVNGSQMNSPTVWMTSDIPYGGAIRSGVQTDKGLIFRVEVRRYLGKYLGGGGIFLLIGMLSVLIASIRYPWIRKILIIWFNRFIKKVEPCFERKMMVDWQQPVLTFLMIAWTLSLVMATISQFSAHPDEGMHSASASYYEKYHFPPPVGDPSSFSTYKSRYGVSYINMSGIDYFLTGKFSAIIKSFIQFNNFFPHRCLNILVFCVFCMIVWFSKDRYFFFPVIMTPQVWYIASYTNNDFFPLILMMIFCFELIDRKSFCSQAICEGNSLWYAVPAGVILGILSISKTNYLVFVLFVACYLFWRVFENNRFQFNRNLVSGHVTKSCLVIAICALTIYSLRTGFDIYQNGFDKNEKLNNIANQFAQTGFKPVDIENDIHHTPPGMRMKKKDILLESLFIEKRWHTISLTSFFGVYGWMNIVAPRVYYDWMTFIIGFLICYAGTVCVMTFQADKIFFFFVSLLSICLMIAASLYHSWTHDFQPQGRYLFPVLGILTILLFELREVLNRNILGLTFSTMFFCSFWSFLFIGIKNIGKIV